MKENFTKSILTSIILILLTSSTASFGQITIDGDFSDWVGVGTPIGSNGTVSLEVYDDNNVLYLHISGTDLNVTADTYIDTDCDPSTGYNGGNVWDVTGQGADILLQGAFSYSSPYTAGNGAAWSWNFIGGIAFNPNSYDPGMTTDIEYSFDLSPGCGELSIGACITDGGVELCIPPGTAYQGYTLLDPLLPVELTSFEARAETSSLNRLTWVTTTEKDNDHFVVQRSQDGYNWIDLDKVNGNGTTIAVQLYEWIDKDPLENNYYKLKQVDYSGEYAYSSIKFVKNEKRSDVEITPNPTSGFTTINFDEKINNNKDFIRLYNQTGIDITGEIGIEDFSDRSINLDLTMLPSGLYYLRTGRSSHPILVLE